MIVEKRVFFDANWDFRSCKALSLDRLSNFGETARSRRLEE